ncbi:MAG: lysozyme inhibitor LprI family protein [Desulfovibrionaceae bacterium]|nr:lysozyme inhibitor LprI family protein [Desulfovibrionaceae bacterium]
MPSFPSPKASALPGAALALVLTLAGPGSAAADEAEIAPGYNACMAASFTDDEKYACIDEAYEYWDFRLNKNYRALMSVLSKRPDKKKALQKAERSWIVFKENMAAVVADLSGRTMDERMLSRLYLAAATRDQANLLAFLRDSID